MLLHNLTEIYAQLRLHLLHFSYFLLFSALRKMSQRKIFFFLVNRKPILKFRKKFVFKKIGKHFPKYD